MPDDPVNDGHAPPESNPAALCPLLRRLRADLREVVREELAGHAPVERASEDDGGGLRLWTKESEREYEEATLRLAELQTTLESISEDPPDPSAGKAAEEEDELFPPEKRRAEELKEALHWIFVNGVYGIAIMVMIVTVGRAAHLAIPESWHWLSPAQISTIDNWIIGGFIASSVSQYIKERTGEK